MAITKDQVRYVAYLSRLALSDEEMDTFAGQLDEILRYVEKLGELDTTRVEPLVHAIDRKNVFREDVPAPSLQRSDVLSNAPEVSEGCFKVPRIIE